MLINSISLWNLTVDRKMIKTWKWFEFERKLNNTGNVFLTDSKGEGFGSLRDASMKE